MGYSGGSDGGVLASSVQVTGLKAGGVLSQASGTTVDWTAGNGQVVSYADPNTPSVTPVSWDAVTGYTPTNLATDETTVFAYNSAGTLVEILASALTALDTKNYIIIGSVTHISSVIIKIVASPGNVGYDGIGSFKDFASLVVGPANITGNVYGANGTNLNLNVIGGQAFILASNFRNDPDISDIITLPSETAQSFSRVYRQADPSLNIAYESLSTALIDPSKYDDGTGTLATVPATNWTIQRIFRSRTGGTFVAYGQQLFTSKSNAIAALESESFQEKAPLPLTLYRTSLVIEQNATDLSDLAQAEFFAQSSFRTNGLGSASATIPGVVTPGGSDKSVQFNDGNTFGGNTDFTYDKTTKALTLDTGTVKAFSSLLNNLEILGTSNTASAENDNWKIETSGIYLIFYRRQNDAWVEVFTTGASLSTDRFIINTTGGSLVFDNNLGQTRTLVKPSVDENGAVLGNANGRVAFIHSGELFSINIDNSELHENTVQDQTTEAQSITDYTIELTSTIVQALYSGTISLANVPASTKVRFSVLSSNDVLLAQNVREFEFQNGGGTDISTGINELILSEELAMPQGYVFKLRLESNNSIDIQGKTVDLGDGRGSRFVPYLIAKYMNGVEENVTTSHNLASQVSTTTLALADGTTAATQSPLDNTTKIATTAYVDTAVSVEDLWDRTGTVLSPKNVGDDVLIENVGSSELTIKSTGAGSNYAKLTVESASNTSIQVTGDDDARISFSRSGQSWQTGMAWKTSFPDQALDYAIHRSSNSFPDLGIDKDDGRVYTGGNLEVKDLLLLQEYGDNSHLVMDFPFSEYGSAQHQYDRASGEITTSLASTPLTASTYGKFGSGALLAASQGWRYNAPVSYPTGANVRTVEFWCNPSTVTAGREIVFSYGSSFGLGAFAVGMNNGQAQLAFFGSNNDSGTTDFTAGNWYLCQATYDGTTAKMYVNNVEKVSVVVTLNTVNDWAIVGGYGAVGSENFQGKIAQLKMYGRVLNENERKTSYLRHGGNTIATTQASTDNSRKVATTAFVQEHVSSRLKYVEDLDVDTGTTAVDTIVLATGDSAFWNYTIKQGTNLRAGTITACWDASNIVYTETSTTDIGDTSGVTFVVVINTTDIELQMTVTTDNWSFKANRELL